MGDFTLGCLLGQDDGAQSFEVASAANPTNIQSWTLSPGGTTRFFEAAEVHSSAQAYKVITTSYGVGRVVAQYQHSFSNDLLGRAFPDVNTHRHDVDFWARVATTAESGQFYQDFFLGVPKFIPYGQTLSNVKASPAYISNNSATYVRFVAQPQVSTATLYLDDVLTRVDQITLYPEWSFQEQARLMQSRHRTLGGKAHVYTWGKYFAYEVPLRFLSTSHAALINWWWERQFQLLFTLDTSDSESSFIVRIANDRQPIGGRVKPYADLYQGVLQLESVHDGRLSF